MTFYDDAEFAAIKALRIAASEEEHSPKSAEMHQVVMDMFERHGSDGVSALVIALARQYAAAANVVAHYRDETVDDVIDGFEHHKLDQIVGESGD